MTIAFEAVVWLLAILCVVGIGRLSAVSERWKWGMGITLFALAIVGVRWLLWGALAW
jgi:hypothetical protein